ncbi:Mevalonate kinase [Dirofilaria immitis]
MVNQAKMLEHRKDSNHLRDILYSTYTVHPKVCILGVVVPSVDTVKLMSDSSGSGESGDGGDGGGGGGGSDDSDGGSGGGGSGA